MEHVDVVIIGGGLAGLTAARSCARHRLRSVVLERAAPGGRARSVEREGFTANLGPHALYLEGAAVKVMADLGVALPAGASPALGGAKGRVGEQVGLLPGSAWTLARTGLLGGRGKVGVARLLRRLPETDASSLAAVTTADWLASLRLPPDALALAEALVRLSTYVADLGVLSAEVAVGQLQLALSGGVRYLDGGWQRLVGSLAAGVDVRSGTVSAVVDCPEGFEVHTTDGAAVTAGAVVATVGGPDATAGLLGVPRWRTGPPALAACSDLALRRVPPVSFLLGIDRPLYLSAHAPPAELAPPGGALVQLARYLSAKEDPDRHTTQAELDEHAHYAGIEATDVVWSRYLHRMVVVEAVATAAAGGLQGRPPVAVPGRPGAFVAGDWVGPVGHLADAAMASGAAAATAAVHHIGARLGVG
ncbi:MAG: NAD(P)-binding protein [Acidimicrobiia bacterium]|nr:NAD(P)-binding protein [Acidimicrobiia bacterium]